MIGYGRVSTNDQNPALQRDALLKAGVHPDNLHIDEGWSGAVAERPKLSLAFLDLREGDTLVVWKLDRLGRSVTQLIAHAQAIADAGAHFVSLTERIDTTSPAGMLFFHFVAAFAEFERSLISERTKAGIAIAKAAGKRFGAKPKMTEEKRVEVAAAIMAGEPLAAIAKRNRFSVSLIRKHFPNGEITLLRRAKARRVKRKR